MQEHATYLRQKESRPVLFYIIVTLIRSFFPLSKLSKSLLGTMVQQIYSVI